MEKKTVLPIGEEEICRAREILNRYSAGKEMRDAAVRDNDRWYRRRHRQGAGEKNSAWLFNVLVNKHADFTDALPECSVLPREESDRSEAERLCKVIPVILERSNWQKVYSNAVWSKLKSGTAVYSVVWNPSAENGMGEIEVLNADILRLFWEPGVRDIQDSRNLFYVELADKDILEERFPQTRGRLNTGAEAVYMYDENADTSGKVTVVDWYYKKRDGGKTVLHYAKFTGDILLYASENDPDRRERGWYDHGLYPFVMDTLFPDEGAPCGFGFLDVLRGAQDDIDTLGNELVANARIAAKKRYFTRVDGCVNEKEFANPDKVFIHVTGSSLGEDSIREITNQPLPAATLTVLSNKIQELKETSGNRDFSQGGTSGGVTSGTAISALQEAGSKLSRDMISDGYNAFSLVCQIVIELIRQFYSAGRTLRITGKNGIDEFIRMDNSLLKPGDGLREPVFDLSVKASKQTAFNRERVNSEALSLYREGFFAPERADESLICLEMMDIDGKERLKELIEKNMRGGDEYN